MRSILVTAPTSEPVTLTEAKLHLGVTDADSDAYITGLITAARTWCEMYVRQSFITTRWRAVYDRWPSYHALIPNPPLMSVIYVKYYDDAGALQTLAGEKYVVDTGGKPGRVVWAYDVTLPPVRTSGVTEPIAITYDAGYGAASAVPQAAKLAILLLIGHWMDRREDVMSVNLAGAHIPMGTAALLSSISHGDYP